MLRLHCLLCLIGVLSSNYHGSPGYSIVLIVHYKSPAFIYFISNSIMLYSSNWYILYLVKVFKEKIYTLYIFIYFIATTLVISLKLQDLDKSIFQSCESKWVQLTCVNRPLASVDTWSGMMTWVWELTPLGWQVYNGCIGEGDKISC